MSDDRVTIFDTTLRDGEQSPGCSMNTDEKLRVAEALCDLGVDVIEAGFPVASPGDFDAVSKIAERFGDRATICGLARCRDGDIDAAADAVTRGERGRVHVFLATSAIHREHKLRMSTEQIVERAVASVQRAKERVEDVEFSPEDAYRTERDFLCEVVEKAIDAGATTVNIPDTVGYATPQQYFDVIKMLKESVPNIDRAVISTHCHDDLGMAVANTLAGLEAGARQVECTINGIGERAGNAALEEIVMALRTRSDHYGLTTGINTRKLSPVSRLVGGVTGQGVPRNKAVVGRNAFAHASGIHQDGMLKNPATYEIMRPEDVGFVGTDLVLGKHSGRAAVKARLTELGYTPDDATFAEVFDRFIDLADRKKEVFDADLAALMDAKLSGSGSNRERWTIKSLHTSSGTTGVPTATLELIEAPAEEGGETKIHRDAAIGDGPIDACFNALERIIGIEGRLDDFVVKSVTRGKDALGQVDVRLYAGGRDRHGRGVSTDIIEAGARAFLQALNRADADRRDPG
ncbi:2-isopropylmalate synthase [Alienimonas californiensis]|uniref:2-isopropylmalate synthase n=1 Tax=Alienimonas californiensis TaxID=2527989 RepID=A0A517PAF9_9PLAN|nr:2-isopropylmalate synthase [Alienimonas californiensis]QDT16367.1 2-isopropylmalate synthase [Alienimonas californiensis]